MYVLLVYNPEGPQSCTTIAYCWVYIIIDKMYTGTCVTNKNTNGPGELSCYSTNEAQHKNNERLGILAIGTSIHNGYTHPSQ